MKEKKVLAIDLGASSGRVMLASFDGRKIRFQEIHRFSNDPVNICGTMYWDVLRIFYEIQQGIVKSKQYGQPDSLSLDTWGVDFGLLDKEGRLLENPVHYRDRRTLGMTEESLSVVGKEELYQKTGIQIMDINTLFQLLAVKKHNPKLLDRSDQFLLMPDLFHYFLCGTCRAELSIASTTQMLDPFTKKWSRDIQKIMQLPEYIFPELVPGGNIIGTLRKDLRDELGLGPVHITASAGHDTQSAMAAVPAEEKNFIFISCGTWSLFGTELSEPLINATSYRLNMTNEQGISGKTSFLKNIMGLWLIQESRRQWMREGKEYSFAELENAAAEAKPFQSLIDTDNPMFISPGNIPERIRRYCQMTAQHIPESVGEMIRCINESLALKYSSTLRQIQECTGKNYSTIYMVGGGTKSNLLCQMTAEACGCTVIAGSSEASALGNAAIQYMALGELADLSEIRRIVRNSTRIHTYYPDRNQSFAHSGSSFEQWMEAMERFTELQKKEI